MERISTFQYIQMFSDANNNKYRYYDIGRIVTGRKITVTCLIHGPFSILPEMHLKGKGCIKCLKKIPRMNTEEFIKQSSVIHNNKYDYSQSKYTNWDKKIRVKCPINNHGVFWIKASSHISFCGCPKCNISKGESKIIYFLETHKIDYRHQYVYSDCFNPRTNHVLIFDFYLPYYNTCIEFDGEQHYKFVSLFHETIEDFNEGVRLDEIKNNYCILNKIRMLRIKYTDYLRIDEILIRELEIKLDEEIT